MKKLLLAAVLALSSTVAMAEGVFTLSQGSTGMTGFNFYHYNGIGEVGMYGSYATDWAEMDGYVVGDNHLWHYATVETNVEQSYDLLNIGATYRINESVGAYLGWGLGMEQEWDHITDAITCGGYCREPDGITMGETQYGVNINIGAHYTVGRVALDIGYNTYRSDLYAGLGFTF